MKQIEKDLRHAIAQRRPFKQSNTAYDPDAGTITLYGNTIARLTPDGWRYTLAGWPTVTTKSRLKALGLPVWTKAGRTFLGSRELDANEWFAASEAM